MLARRVWRGRSVRYIANFYNLFPSTRAAGPPPRGPFDIDLQALRADYLKAQQKTHPDSRNAPTEVDSAAISTAYKTLVDPLARAEHILQLNKCGGVTESTETEDEEILMDVFMLREQLSECEDDAERAQLLADVDERARSELANVKRAIDSAEWEIAQRAVKHLSYWRRLQESVQN